MSEPTPTDDESIDDDQAPTDARPGSDSQPGAEAASSRRTYLKATGLLAALGLGGVASSGTAAAKTDHNHLGESWAGAAGSNHGLEVTEQSSTGFSYGLRGISDSEQGRGVFGLATATSGQNYGLWGKTESTEGIGLSGTAAAETGQTQGVYAVSKSDEGQGVFGRATSSSGDTIGVKGQSLSDTGTGVRGEGGTNGYGVVSEGDAKVTEFLDVAQAGTRDRTALELDVDGERALRIDPTTSIDAANIVGGDPSNSAASGVVGATIAGGGFDDGSFPQPNEVFDNYGTVGGGVNNQAGSADGDATTARYATVGGGTDNTASGKSATVPGGFNNTASGGYSFAAGREAKATNDGAFVFGDSSNTNISSQGSDEVRSQMPIYAPAFNTTSARAKKTAVESVNAPDVLERVEDLDVNTWELAQQDDGRHMGPMAEEFADAFELGDDNEHIATVDADGVALAAIQGLADRLGEKDERIEELESEAEAAREEAQSAREENARLRERLAAVEETVSGLAAADAGGAATPADD